MTNPNGHLPQTHTFPTKAARDLYGEVFIRPPAGHVPRDCTRERPGLCGACGIFAVIRFPEDFFVRYWCGACAREKTIDRRVELPNPASEAYLIHRPAPKPKTRVRKVAARRKKPQHITVDIYQ